MGGRAYTYFVRPRGGDKVLELEADTHVMSHEGYLELQAFDAQDNLEEVAGFDKPAQWWRLPRNVRPPGFVK